MKRKITIEAPVDYYSGYSAKARDFAKALILLGYDVEVFNSQWHGYQNGFLQNNNETAIIQRLIEKISKPDIYVCIDCPLRFARKGRINIGITAGIETDRCNKAWFKKLNMMDLVLVPSQHSKDVFEHSQTPKIRLKTPIKVIFEGADNQVFFHPPVRTELSEHLDKIECEQVFLFVGQWLPADGDNDRKNVTNLIRYFLQTFAQRNDVALLLKTAPDNSTISKIETEEKIEAIRSATKSKAPVYNLHGSLTDKQMSELYHHPKIKWFVSLTRGEGFGRPLLEFSFTGKPIIATNWSGHLDFLDKNSPLLIRGELKEVHESVVNSDIIEGAKWAEVDFNNVQNVFHRAIDNYETDKKEAQKLAKRNITAFSLEKMTEELEKIFQDLSF